MNKTLLLLIIFISWACNSYSQQILSLHIHPTNPTTADVIHMYADVSFQSGGCDDKMQNLGITGNNIYGYALHCLGIATFICNTTDTFVINPLPAGNYSFILGLDAGGAPSPCTPGIVAGPTDTLHFTVTSPTSISKISSALPEIYLNASTNMLIVDLKNADYSGRDIQLFNILGDKMISQKILESKFNIDVNSIPDGIYVVKINDAKNPFTSRILKRN